MKFGGASVATPQHFSHVAEIILLRLQQFKRVAVVVSAMGDTTNQLISLASQVNPAPPRREYDMLVSVGERISISLLAMALAAKNHQAVSFTGSQSGIITCNKHSEARIVDVRPHRLLPVLDAGNVVIVAGFQGVSRHGEITTLGRGGSDTTAVALGIALGASRVEFFKDVPGIYCSDPKLNASAELKSQLTHEEALDIIRAGAKVLEARSVILAGKNEIPLHVLSFHDFHQGKAVGTVIGGEGRRSSLQPIYEE